MRYILLAVLTFGFGSGYGVAYKVMRATNLELENRINVVNVKVQEQAKRIKQSQNEAVKLNEDLNKEHEKNITLNSTVKHSRLYDNSTACRMSKSNNPASAETIAVGKSELSRELTKFLWEQSARADRLTIERNTLLSFVKSNCGIK